MKRHYIDNRFREELDGLEANPPVEAWLAISNAIDGHNKRPGSVFLRMAASIAVLLAATFSFWYFFADNTQQEVALAEQNIPISLQALTTASFETGSQAFLTPVPRNTATRNNLPNRINADRVVPQHSPPFAVAPSIPVISNTQHYKSAMFAETQRMSVNAEDRPRVTFANDESGSFLQEIFSVTPEFTSRISLGLHFAPQYNYRLLREEGGAGFQHIPFQALEDQLLTYNIGISAYYQTSSRWSFQTGIHYINVGQYVRDIYAYTHPANMPIFDSSSKSGRFVHPQSVITSQGSIRFFDSFHYYSDVQSYRVMTEKQANTSAGVRTLKKSNEGLTQVFRFIEVPLIARYNVYSSAIGIQLKAGLSAHYLLQNQVFLGKDNMQNAVGETYGISKYNLSAIGGLSFDLPLTSRFTFHLEPTAQIFLQPIANKGMLTGKTYPYSFSVQTGVSYGF